MRIGRSQSIWLAVGVLVLFFATVILVTKKNAGSGMQLPTAIPTPAPDSKFTLNTFHRSEIKDGKKVWEVEGLRGEMYPQTNVAKVDTATIHLYRNDGTIVTLLAPTAEVNLAGAELSKAHVSGGITLRYADDFTLTTEAATYDKVTGIVTSDTPTTITGDQFEVKGDTLLAKVDEKSVLLKNHVKSVFKQIKKDAITKH